MPELPEVEICRGNLARWTYSRRVVEVRIEDAAAIRRVISTRPSDKLEDGCRRLMAAIGGRCGTLERRGKRLSWTVGSVALILHLGMTGKWVQGEAQCPRFGRIGIGLDDGSWLWFVDARRFGCVVPVDLSCLAQHLARGLGPDALDDAPDGAGLALRLTGRRRVKQALLDQSVLAGVGNIQAVESLWRAGIHPDRRVDTLVSDEMDRLAEAIPEQLAAVIRDEQGDEIRYLGEPGAVNRFAVYGQEGKPCPQCGHPVRGGRTGGRATFWCSTCQT